MTIDTKQDALRMIEELADKMRQVKISVGIHAADGYRFKYDIAMAWNDIEPAPQAIQDLAIYLGNDNAGAKQYILGMMSQMEALFTHSDRLKYEAKSEINALPDTATNLELQPVYDRHLAIFEAVI